MVWRLLATTVLVNFLLASPAISSATITLKIAAVDGAGWSASGIGVALTLVKRDELKLDVRIGKLLLPDPLDTIANLSINCPQVKFEAESIRCPRGTVRFKHPYLAASPAGIEFNYNPSGQIDVFFKDFKAMGGTVSGQFQQVGTRWSARIKANQLETQRFLKLIAERVIPHTFDSSGGIDIEMRVSGAANGVNTVVLAGVADKLDFLNQASTYVGEGLELDVALTAHKTVHEWQLESQIALKRGQVYFDPVYLEIAGGRPIRLQTAAHWQQGEPFFTFDQIIYDHPNVLQIDLRGTLSAKHLMSPQTLRVQLIKAKFPELYTTYLQPFLIGSVLDELDTTGEVSGSIDYEDKGAIAARVNIDDLSMNDRAGRFGMHDIKGTMAWHSGKEYRLSEFEFGGGHLYKITVGAASVALESRARDLRLTTPTAIPIFDGKLRLESFSLRNAGTDAVSWTFDAGLTPLSMEAFTAAVGWPLMSGKLSGMIPNVQYQAGNLNVGGALLVRAFDGQIVIDNLQLQDPFGLVPQLMADMELKNIDLDSLTRTFSFGRIEGRVDGFVRSLRLVNWQPVFFDAAIATPEDDRSKHRISQRAVDNLTDLGGGVSGAISSSLLRFFDEFSYDRIGLKGKLNNGVCEMDGVAPAAGGGYYIVTGASLPRIDVIGHTRNVDWLDLVERVKNIRLEGGAVRQ